MIDWCVFDFFDGGFLSDFNSNSVLKVIVFIPDWSIQLNECFIYIVYLYKIYEKNTFLIHFRK